MRAQGAEFFAEGGTALHLPEPVEIAPDEQFRIRADGPKDEPAEILRLSGVTADTWFFLSEASGEPVAAQISADSGGHICKNGVGFNLIPDAPLPSGDYQLVLLLDDTNWPLVEAEEQGTFDGKSAITRRYRVP